MHASSDKPQAIVSLRPRRDGTMRRSILALTVACTLSLGLTPAATWAVHPGQWVHSSEADFTAGKTEDTVVTNLGDIKLAARSEVISQIPEDASIIYDMQAMPNGDLYIAAGPEGKLLVRRGDKVEEVLSLDEGQIFSLTLTADGKLLVGVSAKTSRLATLEKDQTLKTLVELPDTRYIWDMLVADQAIHLATGTPGKLLKVDLSQKDKDNPDQPAVTELLETPQANLLCLVADEQGRLYVGSDTDGLIYRVTVGVSGTPRAFVVYDADEPEIGALWIQPDGTLYVGTADANQARPGRLEAASQGGQGRPHVESRRPASPADQPDESPTPPADQPEPGDLPQVPPKPEPIQPPKNEPGNEKPGDSQDGEGNQDDKNTSPGNTPGSTPGSTPDASAAPAEAMNVQSHDPHVMAIRLAQQAGQAANAKPTAQQRDELRAMVRQRLEAARESGAIPMQATPPGARARRAPVARAPMPPTGPRGGGMKQGNAIYRISPDGFVSEVFRESVMILHLSGLPDGSLLVATGNEGRLFRVNPQAAEITRLLKLESQQITSMLHGPDDTLILATSNPATLTSFSPQPAEQGAFTSTVLDASQISLFGKLNVVADIPDGASIAVQTRSGNVNDPEKGPWSAWSEPALLTAADQADPLTPRTVSITSPPARFMQYQLTLQPAQGRSPSVSHVDASFVVPNLKPAIASVKVNVPGASQPMPGGGSPGQPRPIARPMPGGGGPGGGAQPTGNAPPTMEIVWEASDPNNDQLTFTLEYRPANARVWLPLAKDVKENRHEWQTRRVPDGRYVVRVTASDAQDNPPGAALTDSRASDPILIDNTPPAIDDLKTQVAKGSVTLTGQASDALSAIRSIHYSVNAQDTWHYVLPDDLIYDSTDESFTVKIDDLATGQHVITLRVDDARGNSTYRSLIVEIK